MQKGRIYRKVEPFIFDQTLDSSENAKKIISVPQSNQLSNFMFFFLQDQFLFCKWCLIGSGGILIWRY